LRPQACTKSHNKQRQKHPHETNKDCWHIRSHRKPPFVWVHPVPDSSNPPRWPRRRC
jgi:hypothetical protein